MNWLPATLSLGLMLLFGQIPRASAAQADSPAHTWYVAPTGDDDAAGTAGARPAHTLQRAARAVAPGDTVIVRSGKYAGFELGWDGPQNGAKGKPITFKAEKGATIDSRNEKTPDGINLEGASYIVIEGFTIENADGSIGRAGIRSVTNSHVVIRGNSTDDCGTWGIFTSHSDDLLIENNVASRSKKQHGVYVSNACVRPIVRGNRMFDNHECGLHMNGDLSQGGTGVITGALVENNIIYGGKRHRRRVGHQLRRRARLAYPEQPALRQPRQRHLPVPDRRRRRVNRQCRRQ